MPVERLNLGSAPHLIVECNANLDIRGSGQEETRLESAAPPFTVTPCEGGVEVTSLANCTIRMPSGGSLEVRTVLGNFRVKDITGNITAHAIHGSYYARRVGTLSVSQVLGEARIREASGAVTMDEVSGSLTLRDVAGPVIIGQVYGEFLARDTPAGIEINQAHGDVVLRTDFWPETVSRINALGSVTIRLPPEADVRFIFPANQDVRFEGGPAPVREGEQVIIPAGREAATVYVTAQGGVWIRRATCCDVDDDTAFAFAAIGEMTAGLADLTAEIEAQAAMLEEHSSEFSERIRRKVEQRLSAARRQVEAAQRRVEREVERASGRAGRGYAISVEFPRPSQEAEPVSEQERLTILRMLEEGKITVEQAQALLAALEGEA